MSPIALRIVIMILAVLGLAGRTVSVQAACVSLPCTNSVKSDKTAFSVTNTGNGNSGSFIINNTGNNKAALVGRTNSQADNAYGVLGRATSPLAGNLSSGVVGVNNGTNPDGLPILLLGVWGLSDSTSGAGVLGQSNGGVGVKGLSGFGVALLGETTDVAGGIGVWGKSNNRGVVGTQGDTSCDGTYGIGGCAKTGNGAFGRADSGNGMVGQSNTGAGMLGQSTTGIGVWGISTTRAIVGTQGNISCPGAYGVGGCATTGNGALGRSDSGTGMVGQSNTGNGIFGQSSTSIGVWGNSTTRGVVGTLGATSCAGTYAVGGCTVDGDGVVGRSTNGRAGFFIGNVQITGTLTKGAGAFKIDHPLDPQNKYLYHSFVESPDMLGIYTGNVALDEHGEATVILPDWFDALNRDFRYQLTAIGAPGPNLYIAEPIKDNRFKIAGGQPKMTVSWQITGVRHDPYSQLHRIPVEEMKPEEERGKYLYPLAYGKPQEMGESYMPGPPRAVASLEPDAAHRGMRISRNSVSASHE